MSAPRSLPLVDRRVFSLAETATMLGLSYEWLRAHRAELLPHARQSLVRCGTWRCPACCLESWGEAHEDGWREAVLARNSDNEGSHDRSG